MLPLLPLLSFAAVWASLYAEAVVGQECRPQGPIVPRPRLAKSAAFREATVRLADVLDSAVNGTVKAGWDVPNVSFSVAVVSRDQARRDVPVWEYHHLGSNSSSGTRTVDRHSQYLIGSVSKTFTVAVLLRSGLDLDDPITKYLPALGGESLISWDNITLRALASQLSGIPTNLGLSEYYYLKNYSTVLGFPEITDGDYFPCDVVGLNSGCTKDETLQILKSLPPVAPPMERPVYSNMAFNLLMFAVGSKTGKNYSELLKEYITGPLNLRDTYPSPGNDSQAVIPPMDSSWGADYLNNAPTGGLVSTVSDLSVFLHSILSYTILDTPTAVREWIQPRSFLGSLYTLFGMPWEMIRHPSEALLPDVAPGHGHTITTVKKDGIAISYRSRIAMLDEYGVGYVILTAGDSRAMGIINNALLKTLAPVVDAAAREQARELGYAGTFANRCGGVSFNATLTLDDNGLILESMTRNDTDIITSLRLVYASTLSLVTPSFQISPNSKLRLYPAEVSTSSKTGGRQVTREDWRMVWDEKLDNPSGLPGQDLDAFECRVWETVDLLYFGSEPVDRAVFVKDAETGEVLGFEVPFLRSNGTSGACLREMVLSRAEGGGRN